MGTDMEKENFCNLIRAIESHIEKCNGLTQALQPFLDGHGIVAFGDELANAVVRVLENETGDELDPRIGSSISWWLYDGRTDRRVWIAGQEFLVDTPEKLYDFLDKGGDAMG